MNVRTQESTQFSGHLEREFIRAEIKKNGWLYWYWTPEQLGFRPDCGYSGISPDHPEFQEMKTRLGVQ